MKSRMSVAAVAALASLLVFSACTATPVAVSTAPVATTVATPTVAAATAAPSPSPRPVATAAVGLCTNPQMTTEGVIQRYFALSTSKDPRAVSDCFAASWRTQFVRNPSWDEVATQWASAGPAANLRITYGDTVKGCDRYEVAAQMASGHPIGQGGSQFITIGPEAGTPRIFEITTGLSSAQTARTTCN